LNGLQTDFSGLEKDILDELQKEIDQTEKDDKDLQNDTDSTLDEANKIRDELAAKLKDAQQGITDPDQLAALSKIGKKLD